MKQLEFPEIPLKRRMVYAFHSFLNISQLDKILEYVFNSKGAIILMYHSVASNNDRKWIDPANHIPEYVFTQHMKFLANYCNVISMDTLLSSIIEQKRALPRRTTVISFDDGYLDNLTVAATVLKKYNLPATVYLATGYIKRGENQWIDQLYSCFNMRTEHRLNIPEISEKVMILDNSVNTLTAYYKISGYLLESKHVQRRKILDDLNNQLLPQCTQPRLSMNWDDVRNLVDNNKNISLGTHTHNHIDLSRLSDKEIISEIKICTNELEKETGLRPVHFSCPYERSAKNLPEILNKLGYVSSVSQNPELLINSKSFPYALGRVPAPVNISRLAHYTSGNYPEISKLILKGRY
jgi:peptidoglycan/xylan/chitin deacetylase (PgdA/CDA1 family)